MATLSYSAVEARDQPTLVRSDRPSTLRLTLSAIRDGLAASRRYQKLQAAGVPRAEAAARAINDMS